MKPAAPFSVAFGLLSAKWGDKHSFVVPKMSSQKWNPTAYVANARFVSDLGIPVVEWLEPTSGESILDLGCGDGALTLKLKELGCDVFGVDASKEMVDASRELGLRAGVLDGHKLSFEQEFDAVFSNAALHWMKDPERVVKGVWQSLRPGGRFVGEFGGAGNIAKIETAIRQELEKRNLKVVDSPWYFPTPEEYQTLLEKQGFVVERISHFPRPTALPGDVTGWLKTFAQPYFESVREQDMPVIMDKLVENLKPKLVGDDGVWMADYVRLRFRASKPA